MKPNPVALRVVAKVLVLKAIVVQAPRARDDLAAAVSRGAAEAVVAEVRRANEAVQRRGQIRDLNRMTVTEPLDLTRKAIRRRRRHRRLALPLRLIRTRVQVVAVVVALALAAAVPAVAAVVAEATARKMNRCLTT